MITITEMRAWCDECQEPVTVRYYDWAMMTDDCVCPLCGVVVE